MHRPTDRRVALAALAILTVVGCTGGVGGHSAAPAARPEQTSFAYDGVTFATRTAPMSAEQSQFVDKAKAGLSDDDMRAALTALTASQHAAAAKAQPAAAAELIKFIADLQAQSPRGPTDLKADIEASLAKRFTDRKLQYDKDHSSALDILQDDLMQCYSGSVLFALAAIGMKAPDFERPVLIFRPGHVMPGVVVPGDHDDPRLYGIETTVERSGVVKYGPIALKMRDDVAVVDARLGLIAEGLRGTLVDASGVRAAIVARTAEKLHLNLIGDGLGVFAKPASLDAPALLNQSLFAFGSVEAPAGPQERRAAEEVSVEMGSPYRVYHASAMAASSPAERFGQWYRSIRKQWQDQTAATAQNLNVEYHGFDAAEKPDPRAENLAFKGDIDGIYQANGRTVPIQDVSLRMNAYYAALIGPNLRGAQEKMELIARFARQRAAGASDVDNDVANWLDPLQKMPDVGLPFCVVYPREFNSLKNAPVLDSNQRTFRGGVLNAEGIVFHGYYGERDDEWDSAMRCVNVQNILDVPTLLNGLGFTPFWDASR